MTFFLIALFISFLITLWVLHRAAHASYRRKRTLYHS